MLRLLALSTLLFAPAVLQEPVVEKRVAVDGDTQEAIRAVLESAYVEGVFRQRDPDLVRAGFAPTFVMQVYWDEKLESRPLERWLEKMKLDRVPSTKEVRAEIEVLEVTGAAALARLDFFQGEKHTYTDYFGLYETTEGWKVVSKLFHAYR